MYLPEYDIGVPCGKCRHCRTQRAREWATRCVHEASTQERSSFITLTYAEEHLPESRALDNGVLTKFFKRLRKGIEPRRCKYFACGEYGDQFGRPHYHVLLFGEDENTLRFDAGGIRNGCYYGRLAAWPFGHAFIGQVSYDSARYVAGYLHKDNRPGAYGGRRPPFGVKSNGLGKQYCLANRDRLTANLGDTLRGIPVGLPMAYRRWLDIPREDWWQRGKEREEEVARFWIAKVGHDPKRIREEIYRALDQHDRNLEGLENLKLARKGLETV